MRKPSKIGTRGRVGRLREQALRILAIRPGSVASPRERDPQRLIHELEVHQAELEIQNEELRVTQLSIEKARAKYTELYDTAPVGYFTLSPKGRILEVNSTAARLLGVRPDQLLGAHFEGLLAGESREGFLGHLRQIFKSKRPAHAWAEAIPLWDVILKQGDGTRFYACLESVLVSRDEEHGCCCRTAVIDTTKRRQAEEAHRQAVRQLVSAQEAERARIARELHDEFGQRLAALNLGLKFVEESFPQHSTARPGVAQSLLDVEGLLRDLHRLVWNLRPPALDDLGLAAALEQYLNAWTKLNGIPVYFHCGGLKQRRLPSEVETTVYRIAQEALTNVSKHARAARVSVLLEARREHIGLIVEDDGQGFEVTAYAENGARVNGHLGLLGMRERAKLAAGTVQIESTLGVGTTLFVRIPVAEGASGAGVNHQPHPDQ